MNWLSRLKLSWVFPLLGFLSVVGIIMLALMIFEPILGSRFCTLVDYIGDGVHVNFVGYIPESYTVEISSFPSGEREIFCNGDLSSDVYHFTGGDSCTSNGAFFEQIDSKEPTDVPPAELVVEVFFDGKKVSKTFRPEYEITYPNGSQCSPLVYSTTIEFNLSQ